MGQKNEKSKNVNRRDAVTPTELVVSGVYDADRRPDPSLVYRQRPEELLTPIFRRCLTPSMLPDPPAAYDPRGLGRGYEQWA